jgi:hypothetical protein
MTKGTYGGFTFGSPWGVGGGLYIDSHGRIYPQLYGGTPGWGLSAGYSPDLEGYLTGTSISGSMGNGPIRFNAGTSGGASGFGIGTPGVGVTYGIGPYEMSRDYSQPWRTPYIRDSAASAGVPDRYNVWEYGYPDSSPDVPASTGSQDELTPFQRGLQSSNGSIGANTTPAVPFLAPSTQNPLGGGMGGWSSGATYPGLGYAPHPPSPNDVVNDRFGSWSSPPGAGPQSASGPPASFSALFGRWGSARADGFENSSSPVLRHLEQHRRSALSGAPGPLPSAQTASLPAAPSGPIAPGTSNAGFDDISGLPSWTRNALAYQPDTESVNIASPDDSANAASEDRKNIRRLSSYLRY